MMLTALSLAVSLQASPAPDLVAEGENLGRLSTLFALCEPYYATNISAGRRLADDFEARSEAAGWTSAQTRQAYDRGRDAERADLGVIMDATGIAPRAARRHLREVLYPRLKVRCRELAATVPGSIADVDEGDRQLDAAIRQLR